MRFTTSAALFAAAIISIPTVLASPFSTHVLHEKRAATANKLWRRNDRVSATAIVPLRIGLAQTNLEHGPLYLESISHPASSRYGQHLSQEEVHSLFAPSADTVEAVRSWLISSGIKDDEIVHSENKGWLAMDVPASKVEELFKMSLHEYENGGSTRLGCEEYHVPAHLTRHIDYITPGAKLSSLVKKRNVGKRFPEVSQSLEARHAHSTNSSLPANLRNCDKSVTPDCTRALYDIPIPKKADPANAPSFYETGDWYAQEDLDNYFKHFAPNIPNGTEPVDILIDGATGPKPAHSNLVAGEADGDVEVAFGIVYPTIPIVYQVDDQFYELHEGLDLFDNFLDALDGSFCNYRAFGITGNSFQDPTYPDPHKNGFKGKLQCGTVKPATVVSISYGEAEIDIPIRYNKRACDEWMKLGLQGTTVFTATGDNGVEGNDGDGLADGCIKGKNGTQIFNPDFLSSCPYITAVGGTQIPHNSNVEEPEEAAAAFLHDKSPYFSHGGFSNYYPRASYQADTVDTYFQQHDPGLPFYTADSNTTKKHDLGIGQYGGLYNRNGRAFPDVSAVSSRLGLVLSGKVQPSGGFGTSFAAPLWASIISLINTERAAAGKGPVGFINPTLYANPSALNDITSGRNPGCKTQGFAAVEGWDPVTGLGTPNFPKLLEVFMALP